MKGTRLYEYNVIYSIQFTKKHCALAWNESECGGSGQQVLAMASAVVRAAHGWASGCGACSASRPGWWSGPTGWRAQTRRRAARRSRAGRGARRVPRCPSPSPAPAPSTGPASQARGTTWSCTCAPPPPPSPPHVSAIHVQTNMIQVQMNTNPNCTVHCTSTVLVSVYSVQCNPMSISLRSDEVSKSGAGDRRNWNKLEKLRKYI